MTEVSSPIGKRAAPARRRMAVAFVDVVGFSALMADNEVATFDRWSGLRQGLLLPGLDRHEGRLVKSTGDGILATFQSALQAVRWSQDVQRGVRSIRTGLALRIALNWCDVMLDGGDPVGDGVNIAARLQERAAAGGVIATRAVVDAVADEPGIMFRWLGLVSLKHAGDAVEAFDLVTDGRAAPATLRADADRPSIAVLPLRNDGGVRDDDFLAEGVLEDVVLSLAALRELVVISRQTTMTLANGDLDTRDVGRALGVRYVLSGTLRRAGDRLRVALELDDATTGEAVWRELVTFGEGDVFAMQDMCVERVVARIAPHVREVELRRALRKTPESFTAYEAYLRGLDLIGQPDRAAFERGYAFLRRSMDLDSGFAMAAAWAARCHSLRIGQGWSEDQTEDCRQAAELASQAIALDRDNALALATYGHIQSYLFGDYDTGARYLERAREACPNSAVAWLLSSATSSFLSNSDTAIEQAERGLRLSPFDPQLFFGFHLLGLAHYVAGRHDEAIRWSRQSLAENAAYTSGYRVLIAALVAVDSLDQARALAATAMELEPSLRLARYDGTGKPFRDLEASALFASRLRAAGIPD